MHYTRATGSTGATGSIGGRRGGDDLRRRHVAGRADQLGADARDLVEEGEHGREGGALPALSTRKAQSLLRVTLCTVSNREKDKYPVFFRIRRFGIFW